MIRFDLSDICTIYLVVFECSKTADGYIQCRYISASTILIITLHSKRACSAMPEAFGMEDQAQGT